jgi:hypothetical protein
MLQDPQDLSVAYLTRQFSFDNTVASETHHRASMHLESVSSIAATKVRVENHLLVEEVGVEVARALEVRNWWAELGQQRRC